MTRLIREGGGVSARGRFQWRDFGRDGIVWSFALVAGAFIGSGRAMGGEAWLALACLAVLAFVVQLSAGSILSVYQRHPDDSSFVQLRAAAVTGSAVGLGVSGACLIWGSGYGLTANAALIATPIAWLLLALVRYISRVRADAAVEPASSAQLTLVFGAGWLGRNLVRVMRTDRTSPYYPVGFVDDDPSIQGARIDGLAVLGTLADLEELAGRTRATAIVVSIARADGVLLRKVSDLGSQLGIRVLVFPSLEEVLEGKSRLRDVRDLGIEDLIGRKPVNTDVESMAGYLKGKRILVTGAGGSIGSELCRQISKYSPGELIMLDRDETGLQSTELLLEGHGLLMNNNIVLADIRDEESLNEVFRSRRPTVVFHTAALKHLPMLERFPQEAWKTNVIGTLNVLRAAAAVDVETFVNISTDKAANPTSALGYSKRLGERLTAWAAQITGKRYLSVRFGNVLGSRGSLVPVFAAMIDAGGPLTVTDRDVTRFFMSIPEACHLVVQAGGIGGPGEVLILDMGEPVRILDIAEQMIARSGKDIAIVITGLREGEKLHEELVSDGEQPQRPVHPKIFHSSVPVLAPDDLASAAWRPGLGASNW